MLVQKSTDFSWYDKGASHVVEVYKTIKSEAESWCCAHVSNVSWVMTGDRDPYACKFSFEHVHYAELFSAAFPEWVVYE